MIWFLCALVLLLGLLLWLPVRVDIDTVHEVYRVAWRGIFALWVVPGNSGWQWFFQVFFWKMRWQPGKKAPGKSLQKAPSTPPAAKRKNRFSMQQGKALLRNLLKAIKIEHLRINWDTGDFMLNAWLYPVFRVASGGQRQLFINFRGEQDLAIRLQTRLGLLAMAGLRVFLTIKK